MSLYTRLIGKANETIAARDLVSALDRWHDEMVLHQRHVMRLGTRDGCSSECPHATAVELWKEARRVLGPSADRLEFLRECAGAMQPMG